MTKNIYIIRHGQTEYNKLGMVQGSGIDSNLNELGKRQAEAFYDAYNHIPFDTIYTSLLKRTHQSVAKFIKKTAWQQLSGLNEISWGDREGRIITTKDDAEYFKMIEKWNAGKVDFGIAGGESPLELQEKQKVAIKHFMNTNDKNILICMHGRAIRILLCTLLGIGLENMQNFPHQNLCLYLLKYENGKFELQTENNITHLEDDISLDSIAS